MTPRYPDPPTNLRSLRDRLVQAARREGVVFGRLQQHVATWSSPSSHRRSPTKPAFRCC